MKTRKAKSTHLLPTPARGIQPYRYWASRISDLQKSWIMSLCSFKSLGLFCGNWLQQSLKIHTADTCSKMLLMQTFLLYAYFPSSFFFLSFPRQGRSGREGVEDMRVPWMLASHSPSWQNFPQQLSFLSCFGFVGGESLFLNILTFKILLHDYFPPTPTSSPHIGSVCHYSFCLGHQPFPNVGDKSLWVGS